MACPTGQSQIGGGSRSYRKSEFQRVLFPFICCLCRSAEGFILVQIPFDIILRILIRYDSNTDVKPTAKSRTKVMYIKIKKIKAVFRGVVGWVDTFLIYEKLASQLQEANAKRSFYHHQFKFGVTKCVIIIHGEITVKQPVAI